MKKLFFFLLVMQCVVSLSVVAQGVKNGETATGSQEGGGVGNGMVAPDFTAKDQNGNTVSLSQFKGKKVVLYFYPKDFTAGCTAEACNLRDNYDSLTKAGYTILGVSTDNEASHKDFKTKYNLPFTLVADVDTSINKEYGVWVQKPGNGQMFWGTARTTFIIDEKGVVIDRIDKVDPQQHAQQVLYFKPEE